MLKKSMIALGVVILLGTNANASVPVPRFLEGSLFHKNYMNTDIDPLLLYSISLAESAYKRDKHSVGPAKYALRYDGKSYYPKTESEAKVILTRLLKSGAKNIDVGLMQINLRWNGHRVASPFQLFDAKTNLSVASDILLDAMLSSPSDIRTAIGRYHNWNDQVRSLAYADRVLRIYTNIKRSGF